MANHVFESIRWPIEIILDMLSAEMSISDTIEMSDKLERRRHSRKSTICNYF